MTNLTLIAEDILSTMRAIEKAHTATENLHPETHPDALCEFRGKMMELADRLEKLKFVLDHAQAFVMDELVDALSLAYTGHQADYRKTPRMNS